MIGSRLRVVTLLVAFGLGACGGAGGPVNIGFPFLSLAATVFRKFLYEFLKYVAEPVHRDR